MIMTTVLWIFLCSKCYLLRLRHYNWNINFERETLILWWSHVCRDFVLKLNSLKYGFIQMINKRINKQINTRFGDQVITKSDIENTGFTLIWRIHGSDWSIHVWDWSNTSDAGRLCCQPCVVLLKWVVIG